MIAAHIPLWTIACWAMFALFWFLSAFTQKQTVEKPIFTLNNLTAQACFIIPFIILVRPEWIGAAIQVLMYTPLVVIISAAVCVIGLAICIWARITLAGNWSTNIDFKKGHRLVQNGPYALVRHPIYTGFLLLFLGSAIAIGMLGGLLGFAVLMLGCALRIRQEEALMIKHFKKEYADYKSRTKALVPFLI